MTRLSRFVFPVIAALSGSALIAADMKPADPSLSRDERQELIDLLESSEQELMELIDGVEGDDWSRKQAPDKWSVGDVVEHLMLTEKLIFHTVQETLATEPRDDWASATAGKEERILQFMPDRSQKATAPGPVEPKGEMSREEIVQGYAAARAESLAFLRDTDQPLKQYVQPHPAEFFGDLHVGQWLLFMGQHNLRHNQQIVEVKETLELE